eukprot:364314-Chlamydomonas_euryale.AAC.10
MIELGRLALVFDLDETLLVANSLSTLDSKVCEDAPTNASHRCSLACKAPGFTCDAQRVPYACLTAQISMLLRCSSHEVPLTRDVR